MDLIVKLQLTRPHDLSVYFPINIRPRDTVIKDVLTVKASTFRLHCDTSMAVGEVGKVTIKAKTGYGDVNSKLSDILLWAAVFFSTGLAAACAFAIYPAPPIPQTLVNQVSLKGVHLFQQSL